MYLIINGNKHKCTRRIYEKDAVKYHGVSPAVEMDSFSGKIQMFRDDGFLLSEDTVEHYQRKTMTGTLLVLTNKPVPAPEDPTQKPEHRLSLLEAENKALREQMAEIMELVKGK